MRGVRIPRVDVACATLFLCVLWGAVLVAPLLPLKDPLAQNLMNARAGFSLDAPFGTDGLGRDVLSRIIFGGREVFFSALMSLSIGVLLGSGAGVIAGFKRGWFETLAGTIADMLQSIPAITIMLAVLAVFQNNVYVAMIAFGILVSGSLYRVARAATLAVAQKPYIAAARLSGMTDIAIIVWHLMTRIKSVLIVQASIVTSLAIVNIVGLSVLGLGTRPPTPSWGAILQDAGQNIYIAPWMLLPPSAVVGMTIMSLLILGDYFQDREAARIGRGSIIRPTMKRLSKAPAPQTGAAILSVSSLSVGIAGQRDPLWLIEDISFEVKPGETLGLVGESGAGKSVAARTALGLFPQNAVVTGSVQYGQTELTTATQSQLANLRGREISFIAQQPMSALDPAFSVGQLLGEAVRQLQGLRGRAVHDAVLKLLQDVQIRDPERVVKLYPHEISGGMAQRVGIALALTGNPKVVVADEPTTALDVTVQREVLHLLKDLQRERGLALLLVTHDWGGCRRDV